MKHSPLAIENASVRYGSAQILDGITFEVPRGQIIGVAGPNGSGKTTLMRAMFAAQKLSEGRVLINGRPASELRPSQIARQIAVVSQFEHDMDRVSVFDLVLLGRAPHRKDVQGYSKKDRDIALQALASVGMEYAKDRYIDTLSGGERQRVLIARSLAQQCKCLLLDEPTNHLDVKYQHQILSIIKAVSDTAVIILHDLNLVARYCDHTIILKNGRLYAQGKPAQILTPQLISEVYEVSATEVDDCGTKQFIFKP
ncbi:MAG: ABC transporter ATP-binding protein [Arcanobacterium sp.]|nr:ABC transporter ATP-binding protein [Arcanobacterium sp.]MDY5588748.1 ABC transporter ATP-binding protein [Arcanobacterium sp.]